MNSKNILIVVGVLGIGLVLYKLLLGLVLPIALFVSLGYVLKFLLKGGESDSSKEASQILTNSETSSSIENIVEIQPIEDEKATKDISANEDDKATKDISANEDDKATKDISASDDDTSTEDDTPISEDKPF